MRRTPLQLDALRYAAGEHDRSPTYEHWRPATCWMSERILYWLAKRLYRTEVAHTNEMKEALSDADKMDAHRATQARRVIEAAGRFGIELVGRDVLDLGCSNGAITIQLLQHGAGLPHSTCIDTLQNLYQMVLVPARLETLRHPAP